MKRIITSCMCFAICIALFAQATNLTIDNQTPGWLSSKINYGDQQTVKNLKVTGYINMTDLKFIGNLTQLSLNGIIDLGDATIVGNAWNGNFRYASTSFPFDSPSMYVDYSYNLQKLILPHSLTSYYEDGRFFNSSVDTLVFDTQVNKIGDYKYAYFSSYYNGSGKNNNTQRIFSRKTGHLILGENVDSLMNLTVENPNTVHFPKSLKYIAPYACIGYVDLSQWNIREFPNLETISSYAFTYRGSDYTGTETINNSATLPDSIFFPNIKGFSVNCFDYKEGMHIFLGDKLEVFGGGGSGFNSPCKNVSFHFRSMSPPEVYGSNCSSCKVYVPKGTKEAYQSAFNKTQYTVIEEAQPLKDIALDKASILMEVSEKAILTATPVPENADDINMIWSVDKPEVISVTEGGVIEALSSGTAVITITSTDGKIEKKCTVCVKTHATDVTIEPAEVAFTKLGDMVQLQAVVLPEETYDKSVKWTSSNPSVCIVTTQGKLVAMGYGDAVVMAVTNDGEIPATCVVKVTLSKYKLTYMVDGEEYASYNVQYTSSITPETAPTKDGYTFSGWNGLPATMPEEDVIVKGYFNANKYALTYKVDGEVNATYEIAYGTDITPDAEPTKKGYIFSGWSNVPETMPAHDVTITGSFAKEQYKLTYMVDDTEYQSDEYEAGESISLIAAPRKENFMFVGWAMVMPTDDVTLTAVYAPVTSINDIRSTSDSFQILTPDGVPVNTLQKGVNIIRYSDGNIRKVLVK